MKCANCGNTDKRLLSDEGDTFYCSVCCHRTLSASGEDDLIMCPFCGRLRDRKSYYCMWCNIPLDAQQVLSKEEARELDSCIRKFEDKLDSSNLRYWKIKGRRSKLD